MAKSWTVNDGAPSKEEKYEWRAPVEQQHNEQSTGPGGLRMRPKDLDLQVTLSPKKSGVQYGQDAWTFQNTPDSTWYVEGTILQEDD